MKNITLVTDAISQALGPAMPLTAALPPRLPDFKQITAEIHTLQKEITSPPSATEEDQLQLVLKQSELEAKAEQLKLQTTDSKIEALQAETGANKLVALRNVNGDGNCYYRALLQAYLENQIAFGKTEAFTDLAVQYKVDHADISTSITFKEGQQEKLLSPEQFSEIMQKIKNASTTEKQQQLLVKAFNQKDSGLDLSAVALTRYIFLTEKPDQVKNFITEEHLNNFRQMDTYIEDAAIASSIFANLYNVQVRDISLSQETDNLVYNPEHATAETAQIAVVHHGAHFLAGRTQAVQDTMQDYTLSTVKGLKLNGEVYSYDENELTSTEKLEETQTLAEETGNKTMSTQTEEMLNQLTPEQKNNLHASFTKLHPLLPQDDVTATDKYFLNELDLDNAEKHEELKKIFIEKAIFPQDSNSLYISNHAALYQLFDELNRTVIRASIDSDTGYSSSENELAAENETKKAAAQTLKQELEKAEDALELHEALNDAENKLEESASTTLSTTTPVSMFTSQEHFNSIATDALSAEEGELQFTKIENGYKAEKGDANIAYNQAQQKLTAHGPNPTELLAQSIEAFAKQTQYDGMELTWELSSGINAKDVREHLSDDIQSRIKFTGEASATFKEAKKIDADKTPQVHAEEQTTQSAAIEEQQSVTEKQTAQPPQKEITEEIFTNKELFYKEIGARLGRSSTLIGNFITNHGQDLADYLNDIRTNNDLEASIPLHIKPYLTEIFDTAIELNNNLAEAITHHLTVSESEDKLNIVLKNERLHPEAKTWLARVLIKNQDITAAAPGMVWGVNQALDNLEMLIGDDQLEVVLLNKLNEKMPSDTVLNTLIQHAAEKERPETINAIYQVATKDEKNSFLFTPKTVDALLSSRSYREQTTVNQLKPIHAAQLLEAAVTSTEPMKYYAIPALLDTVLSYRDSKPTFRSSELAKITTGIIDSALKAVTQFLTEKARNNEDNINFDTEHNVYYRTINSDTLTKLALTLFKHQVKTAPEKEKVQLLQQIKNIVFTPNNAEEIIDPLNPNNKDHRKFASYLLLSAAKENKPELVAQLAGKCNFSSLPLKDVDFLDQFDLISSAANDPAVMTAFLDLGRELDDDTKQMLAADLVQQKETPAATDTLIFHPQGILAKLTSKPLEDNTVVTESKLPALHYIADRLNKGTTEVHDGIRLSNDSKASNESIVTLTNLIIASTEISVDDKIDLVKKLVNLPANEGNAVNIVALMQAKEFAIQDHEHQSDENVKDEMLEMLQSVDGLATMAVWLTGQATEGNKAPMESAARAILSLQAYREKLEGRWYSTKPSRHHDVQTVSNRALGIFTAPNTESLTIKAAALKYDIERVDTGGKLREELDNKDRSLVTPSS